ncbi:hypothetical protein FKW31_02335 [Acetobacter sp. DmW_136]|uniref:hypothetical protein n=1 Tax=Acetobacter sp. DmW_136 TaxID=2591091 RepID=UPI00123B820E|nr:hypothetical protein [Acetobacter sp. DmW_136]KAA8388016.1 hypothetical protein FKW31_02335 [Acetobacter sp. DmW_136]
MSNIKKYIVVFDSEGFNAGIKNLECKEENLKSSIKDLSNEVKQDLISSTDVELSDFHIESGISQGEADENFVKSILDETNIYIIDTEQYDVEDFDYDTLIDLIFENDIKVYSKFTDI